MGDTMGGDFPLKSSAPSYHKVRTQNRARFLFWEAHASRVLATASSRSRTLIKIVLARRQNQHTRRVRSPEKCAPLRNVSKTSGMHVVWASPRLVPPAKFVHGLRQTAVRSLRFCCAPQT